LYDHAREILLFNQIKSNQISFISGNMAHKKKVTNSEKDRQKDRHKTYKHTV